MVVDHGISDIHSTLETMSFIVSLLLDYY